MILNLLKSDKSLILIGIFSLFMFAFIYGVRVPAISIIFSFISLFICLYLLLSSKILELYFVFVIFSTLSIEVGYFATGIRDGEVVYSFLLQPFISIWGAFLINIFLFIKLLLKGAYSALNKSNLTFLKQVYKYIIYAIILGYVTLFITYVLNDNNIRQIHWYFQMVISETYRYLMVFVLSLNTILIIALYGDISKLFEKLTYLLLVSLIPTFLISFLLGCKGYRGLSDEMSMLPLYAYFSFGLFAFIDYNQKGTSKIKYAAVSFLLMAIMLFRPSPLGGKWFLTIAIVLGALVYKRTTTKSPFLLILILVAIYFIVSSDIIGWLLSGNEYLVSKYEEAKMLLEFSSIASNIDDYEDSSPAFRIDELLNIFMEFVKKPLYAITGKGIIGSMLHSTSTSWNGIGTFSEVQQQSALFIQVHETLNVLFLKFGLLGLYAFLKFLSWILKSCKYTVLGIISLLWFPFYFGIYQSLFLGVACTIISISVLDFHKQNGENIYQ